MALCRVGNFSSLLFPSFTAQWSLLLSSAVQNSERSGAGSEVCAEVAGAVQGAQPTVIYRPTVLHQSIQQLLFPPPPPPSSVALSLSPLSLLSLSSNLELIVSSLTDLHYRGGKIYIGQGQEMTSLPEF